MSAIIAEVAARSPDFKLAEKKIAPRIMALVTADFQFQPRIKYRAGCAAKSRNTSPTLGSGSRNHPPVSHVNFCKSIVIMSGYRHHLLMLL